MSRWGIAVWGSSCWGPSYPGTLYVIAHQAYTVEVRVKPVSALQSNVLEVVMRFRNRLGQFADPSIVTLRLLQPDGTEFTPTPTPTRLALGVWTYNFDTAGLPAGVWTYRAEGAGQVDAAAEGSFTVVASAFS